MAETFTKVDLSGGTDTLPIVIADSSTTVHVAHATAKDEMWLYASNSTNNEVTLTVEWGATDGSADIIKIIPSKDGLYCIASGIPITNKTVTAKGGAASAINIIGFVNRITTV